MKYIIVTLALLLGGCVTASEEAKLPAPQVTSATAPVPKPARNPTVVTVEKVVVIKQPEKVTCAMLSPPTDVPLPSAPNVRPGTHVTDRAKILLMQSYIRSLMTYVRQQQATEAKTYQSYVDACASPTKSP